MYGFCITDSCLPDVHQEVPSLRYCLANRDREQQTWTPQPAETFYLSENSSNRFKINLFHRPSRQLGCRGYKTPTCLLGPRCSQLVPSWLVGPYGGWQGLDCSHTRWFNLITVLPPLRVFGLWTGPTLTRGGNTVLWHWVWLFPCAEWTISM